MGRGRGVLRRRELVDPELLDEDITDAFLLRSAKVGGRVGSGEGVETSTESIR